jgi:hypothetical protein
MVEAPAGEVAAPAGNWLGLFTGTLVALLVFMILLLV